jgi:hypothetical protein
VEIYALLGNTNDALSALKEALEKHYPAEAGCGGSERR